MSQSRLGTDGQIIIIRTPTRVTDDGALIFSLQVVHFTFHFFVSVSQLCYNDGTKDDLESAVRGSILDH